MAKNVHLIISLVDLDWELALVDRNDRNCKISYPTL